MLSTCLHILHTNFISEGLKSQEFVEVSSIFQESTFGSPKRPKVWMFQLVHLKCLIHDPSFRARPFEVEKHTKHGFGILESEMQDKPKRSVLQIWGCQQQLGWLLRALLDAAESSDKTWVPKCSHINNDTSIVRSKMRDRDLLRSLFHYFITDFLMFISVLRSVDTYCDLLNWLTVFFW